MAATSLAGQVFPARLIGPDGTQHDKLRVLITPPEGPNPPTLWALADQPGGIRIVAQVRYQPPLSGLNGRYDITDIHGGRWAVLKAAGCTCSFAHIKRLTMPFDPDDMRPDENTVVIA